MANRINMRLPVIAVLAVLGNVLLADYCSLNQITSFLHVCCPYVLIRFHWESQAHYEELADSVAYHIQELMVQVGTLVWGLNHL